MLLLASYSVQASDIIYTINVTEKAIPASMDSLKFVTKRNNEVVRFSEVPKLSMFKVNLSNSLIETSISNINYNNLIKLSGSSDGKLTVTSDSNEPIYVQITITNLVGQHVYSTKTLLSEHIDILLPLRQVYIVKVYSKQGIQSTKCIGSDNITCFSVVSSDSKINSNIQKTGRLKINTDSKINIGDTLLLTAYKKDLYPKAIQLIAQQNADVTVDFDTTAVTDIDGNIYKTVKIGTQVWMAADLRVTRYPDGKKIPLITADTIWARLGNSDTDDAYCFYENIDNIKYGALYTYAAAKNACPTGWHLPSLEEWTALETYVNNDGFAGYVPAKLRDKKLSGTDNYGFSAKMAGVRWGSNSGRFIHRGVYVYFWSSTAESNKTAFYGMFSRTSGTIYKAPTTKSEGYCVRCVKD